MSPAPERASAPRVAWPAALAIVALCGALGCGSRASDEATASGATASGAAVSGATASGAASTATGAATGQGAERPERPTDAPSTTATPDATGATGAGAAARDAVAPPRKVVLLAGGDVSFGCVQGQLLLGDPRYPFFTHVEPWFRAADVRFVNLESPLADRGRETCSPHHKMVFVGPPSGADVLARLGVDVVSTANNHAWDYGQSALVETLAHLDRAGIAHAGTGSTLAQAKAPAIVERNGVRLAFVAMTDIWNQGPLRTHPGRHHVVEAGVDEARELVRLARAARPDVIVVSYHGGSEYVDVPLERTKRVVRAALDEGADLVLGHHPHVTHGVELVQGRPVLYSLGNLLMRMHSAHAWTGFGVLARVTLEPGRATPERPAPPEPPRLARPVTKLELCPYRIHHVHPMSFVGDRQRAAYEAQILGRMRSLTRALGPLSLGPAGPDGCAPLVAAPAP